eukprot:TRINITY_DN2528_c0_g1_i1.p1 TRINITY_DN2528_c0_g1~~TRINITY_DN2528_c0_g1_i1.p1  ORF type:complete len:468 (-),score=99.11 TRINITY_DN2528_c0_g1_i1:364-1767(-)
MKILSLLFFVSLSISFAFSEVEYSQSFSWSWTGSVNNHTVLSRTVEIPALGAPLFVSATLGTSFCILPNVKPSTNPATWKNGCLFFHNFTSETPVVAKMSRRARRLLVKETSFNPVPGQYFIAISAEASIPFTVSLVSLECPSPYYGPSCRQNSTAVPENKVVSVESGEYFLFDLPVHVSRIEFKAQRVHSTDRVVLVLRAGNAPLTNLTKDFSYTFSDDEPHSFVIENPSPSTWYGSVFLPASSALRALVSGEPGPKISFSFQSAVCINGTGNCTQNVDLNKEASKALVYTSGVGQVTYFRAELNGPAFNFSVQNKDDNTAAPTVLARYGQFPSYSNDSNQVPAFDVQSSNNTVNFLTFDEDQYEPGTWYFAVVGNGKSFAVWFNNTCPSSCSNNGDCVKKDNVYVCQCHDGYESFDCAVKNESGFKTEYIVLIVIGSIIALAALLGLLVYLYNRNRHPGGGYEKI